MKLSNALVALSLACSSLAFAKTTPVTVDQMFTFEIQ